MSCNPSMSYRLLHSQTSTVYWACDCISILGLKINHVNERGPWCTFMLMTTPYCGTWWWYRLLDSIYNLEICSNYLRLYTAIIWLCDQVFGLHVHHRQDIFRKWWYRVRICRILKADNSKSDLTVINMLRNALQRWHAPLQLTESL